jgi:hypothetical protein
MTPSHPPRVRLVSSLSAALRPLGLGRQGLLQALNALRFDLPDDAAVARQHRVPGRPACFYYRRDVRDAGAWVRLRCSGPANGATYFGQGAPVRTQSMPSPFQSRPAAFRRFS